MDTFLHLPPVLFRKVVIHGNLPIVTVVVTTTAAAAAAEDEGELMWAVEDETAPIPNAVVLPFPAAHGIPFVRRVLVGVDEDSEDWRVVHELWSLLEESILDQIRLLKRGSEVKVCLPVLGSNGGLRQVSLFVEDFDGGSGAGRFGIIDADTEMIVVPRRTSHHQLSSSTTVKLQILPGMEDRFSACLPLTSVGGLSVDVSVDEALPEGFIRVPYYLIEHLFASRPKAFITCSTQRQKRSEQQQQQFSYFIHPEDKQPPQQSPVKANPAQDVAFIDGGTALVKAASATAEKADISYVPLSEPASEVSELAGFLSKEQFGVAVIEGKAGVGKTVAVKKALQELDWATQFKRPIHYLDLQGQRQQQQLNLSTIGGHQAALIVLDHFDEFIIDGQDHSGAEVDEEAAALRFKSTVKRVNSAIQLFQHQFVLLMRSTRSLTTYWRLCGSFPIDKVYSMDSDNSSSSSITRKHVRDQITLNPTFVTVLGNESRSVISALQKHILNPIKYSQLYTANGLALQTGVLLTGPSGSGKSFLAKTFLEAHRIPFLACRGPEVLNKYVGSSEQAIRNLFEQARNKRPCVLFFDEFDSLVPQRGSNQSGVTDRIVNQFLTELDGTADRSGVFILACSSRPELIDKAIMRPGRIDYRVEVKLPTCEELIDELKRSTSIIHRDLIIKFLQESQKENIPLTWADFKLLSACATNDDVARLFAKLERKPPSPVTVSKMVVQKLTLH